jgi:LPS-assembly protein
LLSYGNIAYRWGPWHIGLYAENWQEWETQSEPLYARQPEIRLTGYHQLSASFYQDTQITLANFAATDTALPEVFRTDIATRLGWRAEKGWGYLEPSLTLRATHYEQSAGAQTRLLPVVEFESGLFLERSLTWKAGRESFLRQTLEPKVMFRWVPYENQEALPRLDTDWADSATAMVLGQDRFLGVDRIGDTRQVTFLMASDLLDGVSGKTLAQAMVVRNLYLEDRRVSLSAADPVQTERWSGTAFTLQLYPGRKGWVTASLLTEPDNRGLQEGYLGIRYEKGPHRYFQLERTWVRAETLNAQSSELTLRAGTPIRYNLLATVESRYAVEAQQWRENLAELAYHTCCWAINLSWRQTFPDMQDRGSRNQSVSIGFELKGLGEDRSRRATAQ